MGGKLRHEMNLGTRSKTNELQYTESTMMLILFLKI